MHNRLTVLAAIRYAKRKDYWDTAGLVIFTVLGSLVPVWGGAILYSILSIEFRWLQFTSHGEFVLYATALQAPTSYLVLLGKDGHTFPNQIAILSFSGAIAGFSLLVFSGTTLSPRISSIVINVSRIEYWSLATLAASIVVAYIVHLVDTVIRTRNIPSILAQGTKDFEEGFDETDDR